MQGTELAHRHLNGRHTFHGFGKGVPPRNPVSPQPAKLEPFIEFKAWSFGDTHEATMDERHHPAPQCLVSHSQHRPLTSIPTTEPELICHPQSSLPMLEPPVTTWMGDAVDKEGTLSRMASPCGLPLDSRGLHGRLGWDGESTAGSSRAARGTEGQEGPRQPAPPASWCHRGGWGQLADGEPWAQRASDFHLQGNGLRGGVVQARLLLVAAFESGVTGQS